MGYYYIMILWYFKYIFVILLYFYSSYILKAELLFVTEVFYNVEFMLLLY